MLEDYRAGLGIDRGPTRPTAPPALSSARTGAVGADDDLGELYGDLLKCGGMGDGPAWPRVHPAITWQRRYRVAGQGVAGASWATRGQAFERSGLPNR